MTTDILATVEKLQERADYVAGLRALADLLAENTLLPKPTSMPLYVYVDTKDEILTYLAAMTGPVKKEYEDRDDYGFSIKGHILGVKVEVTIRSRSTVCERIVLGTREVTEEIPDPEALAAVPTITVTKTVEDIRWECVPLLAEKSS